MLVAAPAGTTLWRSSRPGRAPGSRHARGRRGSPRARAPRRRRAGPADARRRAAAAARRRCAPAPRRATSPCASRATAAATRLGVRHRAQRGRRRAAGSSSAASAARWPKTKHSESEFDASRLAPCRPVHAHSPTAYRPATVRAAVEVGGDAAHDVVARGRDRDPPRRRVVAGLAQRARRRWGSAPGRSRSCRGRRPGAPVSASRRWIARATASRGCSSSTKRSPAASCSVAPSPRTASEIRKPSRPWIPVTAVGWNWTNSRSASSAPAARASSRPEP